MKHSLTKFRQSGTILIRSERPRPDLVIVFGIPGTDLAVLEEATDFDALSDALVAATHRLDVKQIVYEWQENEFVARDPDSQKWFDFGPKRA